jgi:alkylhydroperoxidase family enzyme
MSLFPEVDLAADDPLLTAARARTGLAPGPLYRTLAHAPDLLTAWTGFAGQLRQAPTTPRGLRELLILRAAQIASCEYEWAEHRDMAIAAGVPEAQILALATWETSALFDEPTKLALSLAEAIVTGGNLTDALAGQVRDRLTPAVAVELILTVSFYCMASRVLNSLDIAVAGNRADRLAGFRSSPGREPADIGDRQ